MRKGFKQAFVIFLASCVFFLNTLPIFADESSNSDDKEYIQKTTIFHWMTNNSDKSSFLYGLVGYKYGLVCPESEDNYHHAQKCDRSRYDESTSQEIYLCTCEYCGKSFEAYESDLKQSYEAQVAEMPATGYNSDGRLIWNPFSDFDGTGSYYFASSYSKSFSQLPLSLSKDSSRCSFELAPSGDHIVCNVFNYGRNGVYVGIGFAVSCPISGSYRSLGFTYCSYSLLLSSGKLLQSTLSYGPVSTYSHMDAGYICNIVSIPYGQDLFDSELYGYGPTVSSGILDLYFCTYEIIPDSFLDGVPDTYSSTTRPTSITGNYGIIRDDGKLVQVTGNTIVNETSNTYYNPATGETTPITSWSYDYSDRSYTVTKEDGDTTTITYGDENVTITEGDTVYNIYYIVSGDGENPPSSCTHSWAETSRTDPACTTPGQASSSCSKCGETKTETLKATGHTWEVERTVQTSYDENGNLTQEGYTLYKCSVCGEQYKDTEATGPPGPSPGEGEDDGKESIWDQIRNFFGSIVGGVGELLDAVLGKLLDALISLAGTLLEKLSGVVETVLTVLDELPKLFGGFLDLLSILFPFLPPEITLLLTFGVVAVVFAAIIKAIRS